MANRREYTQTQRSLIPSTSFTSQPDGLYTHTRREVDKTTNRGTPLVRGSQEHLGLMDDLQGRLLFVMVHRERRGLGCDVS
jgi:hypothetical protein